MSKGETYRTAHCELQLLSENLIRVYFHRSGNIELDEAKEMHEYALKLSNNKPYCVIVVSGKEFNLITKEATQYLANVSDRVAEAIVVKHFSNRLLAKFYLSLVKTNPHKLFKNEKKALEWLEQYML